MAESDVSICARAAVQLGAQPVQSLSEETDVARVMSVVYPGLKRGIMGRYAWSFLTVKRELTRLAKRPVGEWRYLYVRPSDVLSLPSAVFRSPQAVMGTHEFETKREGIATNAERLIVEFQRDVPEGEWPAYFVELMVAALCARTAFAITDQSGVQAEWEGIAFGAPSEGGMGGLMGDAVTLDSQGSGNEALNSDAFVNARAGGFIEGAGPSYWVGGTR